MDLPLGYGWLANEPGPRMLVEALKLYGTKEVDGSGNNPEIMGWAKELGLDAAYSSDSVPWCGLYLAIVAKRAGKPVPKGPLWALNWLSFGVPTTRPMLGDVMVMTRNGGGHVTLYVGEDDDCYHGLGGNQSDKVCISRFLKSRRPDFRRPPYQVQPANVRVVRLSATGSMSTKES